VHECRTNDEAFAVVAAYLDKAFSAYEAELSKDRVIVPREALVERLARLEAMHGTDLGEDVMVPISNPAEPWGDPIGEQPRWKEYIASAEKTIAMLAARQED
jgi:hypothetical protein